MFLQKGKTFISHLLQCSLDLTGILQMLAELLELQHKGTLKKPSVFTSAHVPSKARATSVIRTHYNLYKLLIQLNNLSFKSIKPHYWIKGQCDL